MRTTRVMPATVRTTSGLVRGTDLGGVHAFLGVPYAAAPVGPLRFAAPAPPEPWDGVRDAVSFGATAPQPRGGLIPQTIIEGDDYLHVNVYTPEVGDARLPVLVWIHGGGMVIGSNAEPWDQGANLARRGMVVVSANYRLGVEGFLPLADAGANRGVLDWLAALRWTQANVAAFGGDPGNVTIGGYSAGSAACLLLLAAPAASGLFSRVIAMSGVPWNVVDLGTSETVADELAARLGVERTAEGIASVERQHLLEVQQELAPVAGIRDLSNPLELFHTISTQSEPGWLGPVVDGGVVDRHPMEAISSGAGGNHHLLIGCTANEMDALVSVTGGSIDSAAARDALLSIGVDDAGAQRWLEADGRSPGQALGAALTALTFRLPLIRVAEARLEAPAPTYVYEVSWQPPTPLGAVHGFDVPYAFDTIDTEGTAMLSGGDPPQSLADDLSGAITRFVTTGEAGWASYGIDYRQVMKFDVPSSRMHPDPERLVREVFASLR